MKLTSVSLFVVCLLLLALLVESRLKQKQKGVKKWGTKSGKRRPVQDNVGNPRIGRVLKQKDTGKTKSVSRISILGMSATEQLETICRMENENTFNLDFMFIMIFREMMKQCPPALGMRWKIADTGVRVDGEPYLAYFCEEITKSGELPGLLGLCTDFLAKFEAQDDVVVVHK